MAVRIRGHPGQHARVHYQVGYSNGLRAHPIQHKPHVRRMYVRTTDHQLTKMPGQSTVVCKDDSCYLTEMPRKINRVLGWKCADRLGQIQSPSPDGAIPWRIGSWTEGLD